MRSKAQLNAISRSYTEKAQKEAVWTLKEDFGIDFEEFRKSSGWKGSPVRLVTSLKRVREASK